MGFMGKRTASEAIADNWSDSEAYLTDVDGRQVIVEYDKGMMPRIRESLPYYVRELLFLVPASVRRLAFDYGQEDDDKEGNGNEVVPASVVTADDYLYAHVTVTDAWLAMGDYQRTFCLMHEFVHLHESGTYHFARRFIEDTLAPGDAQPGPRERTIVDEYRRKYEAQTQEMTHILMQRLWPEIKTRLETA